ncbi:hypothetical protein RQP46_006329 [Phenoliferia psychrophenolica]
MGTGGVAILIGGCPFPFRGQRELGTIWLILDFVLLIINLAGISTRAYCHPEVFKRAVRSHEDGLYLPCVNLAFATLFVGVIDYGLPYVGFWLTRVWQVLWFVYLFAALAVGLLMETTLRGRLRSLSTITPADTLPILPFMLGGTLGAALAKRLPDDEAAYVIIVSYCCQGMGWWLSILKYTAFAFISLGSQARTAFPAANILGGAEAGRVFFYVSVWFGLLLWGTCWWLILSPIYLFTVGCVKERKVAWSMGWWSFTFPLVGFWSAAGQLGEHLPSTTFKSIQVAGIFITLFFWLVNSIMMARGIWRGELLVATDPLEVPIVVTNKDGEERTVYGIPGGEGYMIVYCGISPTLPITREVK